MPKKKGGPKYARWATSAEEIEAREEVLKKEGLLKDSQEEEGPEAKEESSEESWDEADVDINVDELAEELRREARIAEGDDDETRRKLAQNIRVDPRAIFAADRAAAKQKKKPQTTEVRLSKREKEELEREKQHDRELAQITEKERKRLQEIEEREKEAAERFKQERAAVEEKRLQAKEAAAALIKKKMEARKNKGKGGKKKKSK